MPLTRRSLIAVSLSLASAFIPAVAAFAGRPFRPRVSTAWWSRSSIWRPKSASTC